MRISDWSSDVCSSDLWNGWIDRRRPASALVVSSLVGHRGRRLFEECVAVAVAGDVRVGGGENSLGVFPEEPDVQVVVVQLLRHQGLMPLHRAVEGLAEQRRSEEHTSELQSLMRISYAVFCLKKKKLTTAN